MIRVGQLHLIGISNINRNCSFVGMEWAIWVRRERQIVCLLKLLKVYVSTSLFTASIGVNDGWWRRRSSSTAHEWSSSSLRSWRYSLRSILPGASIRVHFPSFCHLKMLMSCVCDRCPVWTSRSSRQVGCRRKENHCRSPPQLDLHPLEHISLSIYIDSTLDLRPLIAFAKNTWRFVHKFLASFRHIYCFSVSNAGILLTSFCSFAEWCNNSLSTSLLFQGSGASAFPVT